MLSNSDIISKIETLGEKKKFKNQAYLFIIGALDFTLHRLERANKETKNEQHVTGQELSHGIKEYAMIQYGPTAKMVLENWGINKTEHFGEMVYNLIDIGLMGRNEKDTIDDFKDVFHFENEFINNYSYKLYKKK